MNTVACTFEALLSSLRTCPESHVTDVHAVNLAAQLAQFPNRCACVAFAHPGNFSRFQWIDGALLVLADYGIHLSKKNHATKTGFFLFATLSDHPDPSPFAGAQVIVLEPEQTLRVAA